MELESNIHLIESQLNKSERLIHSLENSNQSQSLLISSLQAEKASLLDLKESQKSEINSLKSLKITLESQIEGLKLKISDFEEKVLGLAVKNKRDLNDLTRDTQENEEETLRNMRETNILKSKNEELTVSINIYKTLITNLEKSLEKLKENSQQKDDEFMRKIEGYEEDGKEMRGKIKDLTLENAGVKASLSGLQEDFKRKEDLLNNREFELRNFEFKLKEEELNSFKREFEWKANLEDSEARLKEKTQEIEEFKEKIAELEKNLKEKDAFYEEKIAGIEKDRQEIEQLLDEKKQENTRLYAQFQAGMRQRTSIESLRLPFEQETEEKLLQKTLDLQIQHSLTKEQSQKYRNELDLIKEELKRKIPLLEVRKKEYDQMLDQYTSLKSKLELSQLANSKISDDLKLQQKMLESIKKENILASRNIYDQSHQISVLLYFTEKMKAKIHELNPYYDLSVFSDYTIPLEKMRFQGNDDKIFANIQQLEETNKNLLEKFNRMKLNEASQITHLDFNELKDKLDHARAEIQEKVKIIEGLQEKIKKQQTLEDVKQLILRKNPSEKLLSISKDHDGSNKASLQKRAHFYEKHEKMLEENASLRKELIRLKIDLKKLSFSHGNLSSISEKQEERIRNLIDSLNAVKETLATKNQEVNVLSQEKQTLNDQIYQLKNEIYKLKTKVAELEKRVSFSEDGKKAFEEGLFQALSEKKKYFESFLQSQSEISENLMRHKSELKIMRSENQSNLEEKMQIKDEFSKTEQKLLEDRMKLKGKVENQEIMLLQLNKRNLLNSQIIAEQNQQILELNKKITTNINANMIEEGMFSGFVHITQQKNVNFEEIKEDLENQKSCYESLIGKMTEKLGLIEQENLDLQDNLRNMEAANEQLQEKLQESLLKLQEMEKETEKPQINPEELELLNEEKEGYLREIQELNGRIQELVKEKNELQSSLATGNEKFRELNEEYEKLEEKSKEKSRKLEFEQNIKHLKEINLQEQHELFKSQVKELMELNEEKTKENSKLLERIQKRDEERKEGAMEIEATGGERWEDGEILRLRETVSQLELKLQEKIMEENALKMQTDQLRKELEIRGQEEGFDKEKELNQNVEELINQKDSHLSELTQEVSDMSNKLAHLQDERDKLFELNQNLNNQLRMKEVQIVLSQELNNKNLEVLEEGEIERPLESLANDQKLNENEISLIKEIIKDQKLVELLEKCKKILIYQSLETKI